MEKELLTRPSHSPAQGRHAVESVRLQRKCACGGSSSHESDCEECKKKKLQRRASGNAPGPAIAPPIVHEVLRAPGQPLDKQTRAFFEPRFGHDFSRVRVHTDSRAAESAAAVNALAYTVGDDISFAGGRYAPDKPAGRELLAHELAHVIQRSSGKAASSEAGLEEEASRAARAVTSSASYKITFAASPGSVLFVRQTIGGKDFEIGDVVLNAKAATDVKTNGVLFPGPDQAHIAVTGDRKLGYEVAYATPDDPFRWGHLKDIVDKGSLDIAAVAPTDTFKVKEVAAGQENVVNKSLAEIALTAGAITLPRLSVQKAIEPNAKVYIASADDSRDQIFYDSSGQGGRGMLGSNSLAHELFGHLWLSRQGASWKHNTQIDAASGVKDPMGRSYTGGVNEYISHYAGESGSALQSPSQGVGPSLQADILSWFGTNGASGLTRSGNTFKISSQFGMQWERLSGNYSVLKFKHENETQPASTMANVVTTADGLRKWVVNWFNALTPDQQWVFKNFLSALTVGWSAPQGRRTELALDLKSMLP